MDAAATHTSFVDPQNATLLFLVLAATALLGIVWDKSKYAEWFSGLLLVVLVPAVLANMRVIPAEAEVYETVGDFIVPVLIALLLFDANLVRIVRESGAVLVAFLLAVMGTSTGAVAASLIYDVGPYTSAYAGIFTATYIGGVPNFIGVAEATKVAETGILPVLIAVDNAAGIVFFLFVSVIASSKAVQRLLGYADQARIEPRVTKGAANGAPTRAIYSPTRVLGGIVVALIMTVFAKIIAAAFALEALYLLVLTGIAVGAATLFPKMLGFFKGAFESGYIMCYIYIASFAPEVNLIAMIGDGPALFIFALTIIIIHTISVFFVGRLLNLRLSELLVASVAAIWGTGATAALAASRKWTSLITPAVLVSVLGVAIGTFLGVAIAAAF